MIKATAYFMDYMEYKQKIPMIASKHPFYWLTKPLFML